MMRRKFEIVHGSINETVQSVKCELQISEGNDRLHLLIDGLPIVIIFLNGQMCVEYDNSTIRQGFQYTFDINHLKQK